jgi:hypothetical protein
MSNEDHKLKHSERIHQKETKIKKQVKIAKEHGIEVKEPHKFAKHNALNCGVPNCVMCGNPRKVWGEKTMQERKFEQKEFNDD